MESFRAGNLVSTIAGFLILAVLIQLVIKGIYFAFNPLVLTQFWIIWILAIPAYIFYHKSSLVKKILMDSMAPIAIVITFAGLLLATLHFFLGLELIVLGYIFEPIAGISIYLTVSKFTLASNLFFWGAVIYTIGLPLYLVNLGEVAIFGDIIKLIGLIMLGIKMRESKIV